MNPYDNNSNKAAAPPSFGFNVGYDQQPGGAYPNPGAYPSSGPYPNPGTYPNAGAYPNNAAAPYPNPGAGAYPSLAPYPGDLTISNTAYYHCSFIYVFTLVFKWQFLFITWPKNENNIILKFRFFLFYASLFKVTNM